MRGMGTDSSPFVLGKRSLAKLQGVHPRLAATVQHAIALSSVEFTVTDGVRTLAAQRELVRTGASKTLQSRHLPQADGYGHAVDLVPYAGGQPRWEWPLVYPVAVAMRLAAKEAGLELRWGGVWDRPLSQLPETAEGIKAAVADYCARHPGPDFLDGPHYELVSTVNA